MSVPPAGGAVTSPRWWLRGTSRAEPARGDRHRSVRAARYNTAVAVTTAIDLAKLRRIGTALADPTRQRILVQLLDGPGYPTELADELVTTRANLSNHLTCLRECGLVTATAEGRRVRYELADERLGDAIGLLVTLDLPGCCD